MTNDWESKLRDALGQRNERDTKAKALAETEMLEAKGQRIRWEALRKHVAEARDMLNPILGESGRRADITSLNSPQDISLMIMGKRDTSQVIVTFTVDEVPEHEPVDYIIARVIERLNEPD
jgi:hypothetical protein